MTRRYFSSTAQRTTLANPLSNSATTMIVSSVAGFPGTRPYTLILDIDTLNEEIVTVTAASGTTLTVLRGEDGTTAVAHDLGSSVVHGFTGRDLGEPQAHMDTTDGVHGVTGDVVGTEGVQTIIDKNLDGIDNTFTNLPQSAVTDLVADLAEKAPLASPTFTGSPVLPATTVIGDVDATELGRLNGVTSNVQDQLDSKAPIASPTFTGTVVLPSSTSIGGVSPTELAYLDGLTSNIQSQISGITGGGTSVPAGGATDEILVKLSGADYDMAWRPASSFLFIPGTGGDQIVTDGSITGGDSTGTYTVGSITFRWHKFTTTGVTQSLTVGEEVIGQMLVVGAGGGGGGNRVSQANYGGGGGAGGLWYGDYAFGTGIHNCRVGAGGIGGAGAGFGTGGTGDDGEESYFDYDPFTETGGVFCAGGGGGGGAAGSANAGDGRPGGSGGGGGESNSGTDGTGGAGVSGFGFNGGSPGAGGGAAGTPTGRAFDVGGSSVTYATGGSNGSGDGADGEGDGGGGAYGGPGVANGGAGGAGIIIVRYRIA